MMFWLKILCVELAYLGNRLWSIEVGEKLPIFVAKPAEARPAGRRPKAVNSQLFSIDHSNLTEFGASDTSFTMRLFRFVLVLSCLLATALESSPVQASQKYLEYQPFSTRLGVGMTLGPDTFLLVGSVEGHIDRFLSFGPMLQAGLSSSTKLYLTTLGGRYTLPLYGLKRVKFSLHGGGGMVIRNVRGFRFTDMVFSSGVNVDVFVMKGLTAGLGGILNVTGNTNERFIHSIMGMAAYHF